MKRVEEDIFVYAKYVLLEHAFNVDALLAALRTVPLPEHIIHSATCIQLLPVFGCYMREIKINMMEKLYLRGEKLYAVPSGRVMKPLQKVEAQHLSLELPQYPMPYPRKRWLSKQPKYNTSLALLKQ